MMHVKGKYVKAIEKMKITNANHSKLIVWGDKDLKSNEMVGET